MDAPQQNRSSTKNSYATFNSCADTVNRTVLQLRTVLQMRTVLQEKANKDSSTTHNDSARQQENSSSGQNSSVIHGRCSTRNSTVRIVTETIFSTALPPEWTKDSSRLIKSIIYNSHKS